MKTIYVKLLVGLLLVMGSVGVSGQLSSNYVFGNVATGSLTDMSSGTTQLVAAGSDDVASSVTNIGFEFWFMGTRYTQFSASSNGVIRLGGSAVATAQYTLGTAATPLISALGSDLIVSSTGKVHYKLIGAAPNRILVVEFKNMTIIYDGVGTSTDGTYQVRLYETTNAVEFAYGSMNRNTGTGFSNAMNAQYIGFSTNSTDNTYATIVNATNVVTNTGAITSNQNTLGAAMPNLNSAADGSRRVYTFSPQPTTAPSGLNFTAITAVGMTLNWTDNSSDEAGFAIYRSTDGVNYSFISQTAANANSSVQTGLSFSTTYFWKVYAVRESISTSLSGSQATNAAGNILSTGAGGNWSAPGTWVGGVIPTAADNVTIVDGATVTIDVTTATCLNLQVGQGAIATLQYITTPASTLTVAGNVTIFPGGIFQSAATGTITTHSLSVAGDLINNGLLNFSTNANTAAAIITFTGAANNTFGGTGGTTNIKSITINKGTSNANILELNPTNFTVQSTTTDGTPMAFLTLTNGTFKVSGTFTMAGRVFTSTGYTIGATAGFWLNNPNFTVSGQGSSPTTAGLLRITQGTFNVGTATGNSMGFSSGSSINVEGGTINATGRFGVAAAGNAITYAQSGGTITVCTIGNASATLGSFDLGTSASSNVSMSAGTIIVQLQATSIDYRFDCGTTLANITGGTLQMGNASSGAAKTFSIRGVVPNLVITNTSAGHTASLSTTLVNWNHVALGLNINSGATFNAGNSIFLMEGNTINNGTLTANGASCRYYHAGNGSAQTYSGSGVVTAPVTSFELDNVLGLTISSTNQVITSRVILFTGSITGSNKITFGTGGVSTGTIQIGNGTTPTNAGSFDVAPTFNLGTGGEVVSYLRTTSTRTTGPELNNGTRTLTNLTYDDNDVTHSLTLNGGDVSVTGTLTLTNGIINTGANNLIISTTAGTVSRTNGFVNGNFQKAMNSNTAKLFELGTTVYAPATITTAGISGTINLTGKVVASAPPSENTPSSNSSGINQLAKCNHYWNFAKAGAGTFTSYTAKFDFTNTTNSGTTANYKVRKYDVSPGWATTASSVTGTTITATGLTNFSDFEVGELDALPTVTTQPVDAIVCSGNNATFTAASTSLPAPSVQWQEMIPAGVFTNITDGGVYSGSTTGTLTLTGVPVGMNGNQYQAVFTNINGSATSNPATLTVNPTPPTPTITPGGPTTFCAGGSVTLTSSAASGNQWYLNGNPIGGETNQAYVATASGDYTVVVTLISCPSAASAATTVTVNPIPPTPTITPGGPTTFCAGGSVLLTSSAATGNQWYLNGNPIGGETNTTLLVTASGDYTVIETELGCPSVASLITTVTVTPTPDAIATPSSQNVCSGVAITNIVITGSVGGTTFNWTRDNGDVASGNVQGIAASGSGDISGTLTNTTFAPITVTFTITPTASGCPGTPITATVLVNPTPDASATNTPQSICSGQNIVTIALTGNVSGTNFDWTRNNQVAVPGAIPFSGSGDISGVLNLITTNWQQVQFDIVPSANGCSGADIFAYVNVNPIATVDPVSNQIVCNGTATTTVNFSSPNTGGTITYNWTNSDNTIGLASSGTGDINSFTAVNNGSTPVTATITVTPVFNNGINCTGTPMSFTIKVNPTPNVNAVSDQTVCNGVATSDINFSGNVAGTSFNWTNSDPTIGLASSGSGDILSFTAVNTGGTPVTATITVTPVIANLRQGGDPNVAPPAGCAGTPITFTITVNPTPPTPTITPGGPTTFCTGGSVTLTSSAATGNQWYESGNPIGGETNTTLVVTTSGSYTVVETELGCSSAPSSPTVVTVNPIPATPTITPGGPTTFCQGGSVTLTSSAATGNQWYKNGNPIGGATGTTFVATTTGIYSVTETELGCSSAFAITVPVTVNPIPPTPTITPGGPTTFCQGGSVTLTSSGASGNQWYLNGNPIGGANNQNYSATATGNYTVVVTLSGCSSASSLSTSVTVNPIPDATATPSNQTVCSGTAITTIALTGSVGGTTFNWTRDNPGVTGIAASGTGDISGTLTNSTASNITVTFTITPTTGTCTGTPVTATVTVKPVPVISSSQVEPTTCVSTDGSITLTLSGAPGPYIFAWTGSGVNPAAQNQTGLAVGPYSVVVTAANGCTASANFTLVGPGGCTTCPGINSWKGTTSSNWFTASNWFCSVVPTAITDVTIPSGTPFSPVIGAGTAQVHNLTINSGATLTNNATLNVNGGGSVSSSGTYNGSGSFTGALYNNSGGVVAPGNSPGCTTFGAGYTNGTGTENMEIGGTTPCTGYDQIQVTGTATLSGTLNVILYNGYVPSCGESYTIMTATSVVGTFAAVNYPALPAGLSWSIQYNATTVVLSVSGSPSVTATPSTQNVCSGSPITTIVLSGSPVAGTVYNWTRDNTVAATGIAASGTGNISGTLTNTTNGIVTVTFTITPTQGSCTGIAIHATVVVNKAPTITCPGNQAANDIAGTCAALVAYTSSSTGVPAPAITYTFTGATLGSGSGNGSGSSFNTGTTVVTLTATNSCGSTSCSFNVVVTDNIPPVITCPADITLCGSQAVTYTLPTVTDNCVGGSAPLAITQSSSTAIVNNNSVSCNNGVGHTNNSYYRLYDLAPMALTGPFTVNTVTFGIEQASSAGGSQPATVNLYTLSGAFVLANLTLVGTQAITIPDQASTLFTATFTVPPTVPANAKLVVELFTPDGTGAGNKIFIGSNTAAETAPSYIRAPDCGIPEPTTTTAIGFPGMHIILNAAGTTTGGPITPIQIAGLPSGSVFPVGTTINTYQATDAAGNVASCSFNVIIKPIPVATATPSSQASCSGSNINAIILTSTVPGSTYNWTRDNTGTVTGIAASGSGSISGQLTNTTNAAITVTFTITPTANGCAGTPITATVVVNPVPNAVAVPASQTICSGTAITTIVLSGNVVGAVYNWTRDNVAIVTGIGASGSGNISGTLTNITNVPVTVTFTITPSYTNGGGTCTGAPITATVTVNPTATVTVPASQAFCNGTLLPTGTFNFTTNTVAGGGTGKILLLYADGAAPTTLQSQLLGLPGVTQVDLFNASFSSPTLAQLQAYNLVVPFSNNGWANQVSIGDNLADYIDGGGVVVATNFDWFGGPQSVLGRWSTGGYSPFNNPGAVNFSNGSLGTFTAGHPLMQGVATLNAFYRETVTLAPGATQVAAWNDASPMIAFKGRTVGISAYLGDAPTNYSGDFASVIVNAGNWLNGGGTVVNWTNSNPAIGLGASGTGYSLPTFTSTNPGTGPISGTITVSATYTGSGVSCTGPSQTFTITVNPTPNAVATPSSQTKCSGVPITTIALTGNVGGTVFNWTRDNTGTATGIAASGSGDISGTLTNTTNVPVTVTFTITPSYTNAGVTCLGTPITATVLVNPTPNAVAAPTSQTVCSGVPINTIVITGNVAGTVFNWTRDNTVAVTGIAASGAGNISGTLTNTTNAPVTVTFTITPTVNGCAGTPITATVLVNPTPTATATPSSQTKCSGVPITTIVLSGSPVAGTVYNWTRDNVGSVTGIAASGSGDISGTLTNTVNIPLTVTFTITPTANGCAGTPITATVLVNPTPNAVATPSSQTVCSGVAIQTIVLSGNVAGTTFNWTRDNTVAVTGIAASGSGNVSGTLTNTTSAPVTVTFTITPTANGCPGASITATVLVNPTPNAVAVPSSQTVCSGVAITTIVLSGNVAGTVFNWTRDNSATVTGIAASGAGNISGTLTNNTNIPVTVTFTITPTANGCNGTPVTATVLVNPTPNATASPATQTICSGGTTTPIIPSGNVAGTVFNWTRDNVATVTGIAASGTGTIPSAVLTNLTNAPVTVTFTITPTANGCSGPPFLATIVVNPIPNAVATPSSQTICSGSAITTIALTGNVVGTVYNWTRDNVATVTGIAASGTGNIAGSLTNTTFAPITVTFTITPSFTNAGVTCTGPSITATVTVNPIPNAVATPSSQTVCNNTPITTIVLSGNVVGTVFNWTRDNTILATGIAASGTGNISGTLSIGASPVPVTVTFTITPTYTNAGVTCAGPTITATVTVFPTPTVTATPSAQTICSGSAITPIVLTGTVAGTTYTWTRDNVATVTGMAASGSGTPISGTLTNTTFAPVTVTFTITPSATGCTGPTTTATVIVNPVPNAVATPSSQTVCSGVPITTIVITGNVPGTVFTWTRDNTANVTGIGAAGGGNISGTLTNNTNAAQTVTFTITPSYTNGGVTCTGPSVTATVLVNPTPHAVATPSAQSVCSGSAITPIVLTSDVAGTTYTWVRDNTVNVTGIAASGSGSPISGTLTNTTFLTQVVTFTITPTANGCAGLPITATVTVYPTPVVNPIPPNQIVCNGSATNPVHFGPGPVAGTIYNWTNNHPEIGLAPAGTGDIASFIATNTANAPLTALITVTPVANGCTGPSSTFTITVNPTPIVNQPANQVVCNNTPTAAVIFTSPTTGGTIVYNWTHTGAQIGQGPDGVGNIPSFTAINNTGAPVVATFTVIATFTNGGVSCVSQPVSFTITVNPTPVANQQANQTVCNNTATAAVNFTGNVAGAVYNWTNSAPSIGLAASGTGNIPSFTATNVTGAPVVATIVVTPSYTNAGLTCTGPTMTFTITVNPTPTVNAVASQVVCNGAPTTAVVFSGNAAGAVYNWTNNNTSIGLAASGTGNIASFTAINNGTTAVIATITVTPTYTNNGVTCTGTPITFTITVNPTPTVNAVASQTVCKGALTTAINFTGAVAGTTFNWTNNNTAIGLAASGTGNIAAFTATNATSSPITATITVTPTANGCAGTPITFTITVNPTPVVNAVANQTLCAGASTIAVNFTSLTAGTTFAWTNNTPSIGLAASGTGNIASFVAVNAGTTPVTATITVTPSANGCTGAPITFTITVNPKANVAPVANQTLCNGSPTTAITFTGTVAGTIFNWTNSNTAIGLAATGQGNIPSFTATNNTAAPITATITVTPTTGSACAGTAISFTITVNPTPTVNAIANQALCEGGTTTAINFSGATTGTVFTWTNSNTGIGLAASGTGNISPFVVTNGTGSTIVATITVTGAANGCTSAVRTFTITVFAGVNNIVITNAPQQVCLTDTLITLAATPAGGTWSGRGVSGNTFNAAAAGVGTTTLVYTLGNGTCLGSASVNVTVRDCIERHNVFANAIHIYPNPNGGQFNIRYLSDVYHAFGVRIIDADGHLIHTYSFANLVYGSVIPFDLRSLPSGTYFLEVFNDFEKAAFRVVIMK